MDVPGFVRLLKHPAMNGADCWYSAPAEYEVLRLHMFAKHSETPSFINGLIPDKFPLMRPLPVAVLPIPRGLLKQS
jgi:hypothetical protein